MSLPGQCHKCKHVGAVLIGNLIDVFNSSAMNARRRGLDRWSRQIGGLRVVSWDVGRGYHDGCPTQEESRYSVCPGGK